MCKLVYCTHTHTRARRGQASRQRRSRSHALSHNIFMIMALYKVCCDWITLAKCLHPWWDSSCIVRRCLSLFRRSVAIFLHFHVGPGLVCVCVALSIELCGVVTRLMHHTPPIKVASWRKSTIHGMANGVQRKNSTRREWQKMYSSQRAHKALFHNHMK